MYYDDEDAPPPVIEVLYNGRNATYTSDHRTPRPASTPARPSGPPTVVYRPQSQQSAPTVVYRTPPAPPPAPSFLGLNAAELIKLGTEAFAAFRTLPEAPPRATGDPVHDMNNLYDYVTGGLQHWQQAQQVKVIGTAISLFVQR
jgi:hypothetical protein